MTEQIIGTSVWTNSQVKESADSTYPDNSQHAMEPHTPQLTEAMNYTGAG